MEEGIVPGGGVALLRCQKALKNVEVKGDEKIGLQILEKVLETPLRQIAKNAGVDDGVVVQKVKEKVGNFGFNAKELKYEDLMKEGIIDPAKVTRCALENAVSAAGMLLTTECAVTEKPEKKEKETPTPPEEY